MKIPFALPLIDQAVVDEVNDALLNTGWITSGPKVRQLEDEVKKLVGVKAAVAVNSWTSGAMLILKWFGVGPGDEVIVPAYTYSATALAAIHLGARPVLVDVGQDFCIDPEKIREAITPRTKAVIPVDIGGWPCDYDAIMKLMSSPEVLAKFKAKGDVQSLLGRPLVAIDAAHSLGAWYKGKSSGQLGDFTVFSFHSVKNVTTGEGGVICIGLPEPEFDHAKIEKLLHILSLNGQTKSAFEKNAIGGWRYDIISDGLKINLPDICAAIGLAQIKRYEKQLLPERISIFERYNTHFAKCPWAIMPDYKTDDRISSCHLYLLRIDEFDESMRDQVIEYVSGKGVGVNVHYIPMPMLTLFKNMGFSIDDYPVTYDLYRNEISLPIYNNLTFDKVDYVANTIIEGVESLR